MANSYYQVATTPKLYVSYPLFQYASGALDSYDSGGEVPDKDMIQLLQLDPSKQVNLTNNPTLYYKILPSYDNDTDVLDSGLWNFDYMMFLGHNFNTASAYTYLGAGNLNTNMGNILVTSNIVNTCNIDFGEGEVISPPEYDGWSLIGIDSSLTSGDYNTMSIVITGESPKLGSILWGKSYSFPLNCQMNTSTVFEYGVKQKSTISGKTISTANWTKPNNWGTEPFGLTSEGQEGDNFQRRTGRRVWKMTFDSLAPDKVFPQNMMMNDNNYTPQDNHTQGSAENSSLYNINNSEDFYSSVVHKTLGGHLPMVLQLDQNDTSSSNWAIVRLNKDFKVQQKSPLLYTYSITLTEQI